MLNEFINDLAVLLRLDGKRLMKRKPFARPFGFAINGEAGNSCDECPAPSL